MRFLVTEDDFISRKVLNLFLSPHGTVTLASSGSEALELYKAAIAAGTPFNLVCLDIGLPDVSGLEVLKQIRALDDEKSRTAVLMLTGAGDDKNVQSAFDLGASGYLLKPVIESDLMEHLQALHLLK